MLVTEITGGPEIDTKQGGSIESSITSLLPRLILQ